MNFFPNIVYYIYFVQKMSFRGQYDIDIMTLKKNKKKGIINIKFTWGHEQGQSSWEQLIDQQEWKYHRENPALR